MDYLAAANIHRHMIDGLAFSIENQISRLCLGYLDRGAAVGLRPGRMRQIHAVLLIKTHHITGAVRSLCQTGAAPYIRVPQKFFRILTQIHAHVGDALPVEQF